MNDTPSLPRKLMLLIAVGQGIALLLLYNAMESGSWPSQSPLWSYPLWTLALAVPVLLLLSFERGNELRVVKLVGVFAIALVLVAVYIGSQARPFDEFPLGSLTGIFACTMTLACFKALMYLQQRAARMPMSYEILFTNSWRNFLTLALALIFTLIFWLILRVWAALFQVIDINFFDRLFSMDWFLFPVLGLAHGLGIVMFRNLTRVIDSITRLLQALIKLLLPLVLLIALAFIVSLPFVGLDSLWSTGRGTAMLLWLLALILFFTNAVYQDGRGNKPYPTAMHRLLYVALLITPVISILGLYGLVLRVEQYGLSVERCWAFVVWFVLTLFAIGYVVGILRKRDHWTLDLARVNTGMGIVVLAILLLTNSPVLDFRRISLASQLARVEAGEIELADFDFWYTHTTLARPGYMALEDIKSEVADTQPQLLARIENPQPPGHSGSLPDPEWWKRVTFRPKGIQVPDELRELMNRKNVVIDGVDPVLIRADMNADGQDEYALVLLHEGSVRSAKIYFKRGSGWASMKANASDSRSRDNRDTAGILDGEISLEEPRFKNLRIGKVVLEVLEAGEEPSLTTDPLAGITSATCGQNDRC